MWTLRTVVVVVVMVVPVVVPVAALAVARQAKARLRPLSLSEGGAGCLVYGSAPGVSLAGMAEVRHRPPPPMRVTRYRRCFLSRSKCVFQHFVG